MNALECLESADKLLLLIACKDARGLYRFPGDYSGHPGVLITKGVTATFWDQLDHALSCAIGEIGLGTKVSIEHVILPLLEISGDQMALLLLAKIPPEDFIAPECWPTLPDILKKMPKNKMRIPYLKALQILSGALDQEVDAYTFGGPKSSELLEKIWNNE